MLALVKCQDCTVRGMLQAGIAQLLVMSVRSVGPRESGCGVPHGRHAGRAGCDQVTGAEMSTHMCDVGAETVCLNGYAVQVTYLSLHTQQAPHPDHVHTRLTQLGSA